jgi:hypothetical protein
MDGSDLLMRGGDFTSRGASLYVKDSRLDEVMFQNRQLMDAVTDCFPVARFRGLP